MQIWKTTVVEFWEHFLELTPFRQSVIDPSDEKDQMRAEIRGRFLCCKPIVMEAIAEAICLMRYRSSENRPSLQVLVKRLDTINWDRDADMWIGSLLQTGGEKIITGPTAMKFAARFIAHLIGCTFEAEELKALSHSYKLQTGGEVNSSGIVIGGRDLPDPVTKTKS